MDSNVNGEDGSAIFQLLWDGTGAVEIRLRNSTYYDSVCGLCGNFDGDPSNDFTSADGTQVCEW